MHTVDKDHFRSVLGHVPTGVVIVTGTDEDGGPVGFTCGSFFSVSLEPPLVGFCVGKSSRSWPRMAERGRFCVNVLTEGQHDVSNRFARSGGDKFDGLDWEFGPSSVPHLKSALAWVWCETHEVHDAGDHFIVVGATSKLLVDPRFPTPLVFHRSGYRALAESAATAPSYGS